MAFKKEKCKAMTMFFNKIRLKEKRKPSYACVSVGLSVCLSLLRTAASFL